MSDTPSTKIYLYSFASEGLPYDEGLSLKESMDEFHQLCSPQVDKFYGFTPRTLPEEFQWCARNFSDEFNMIYNANYNKVGLGSWRSFLLYSGLNNPELKDGDIVLIHDVNYKKYPQFTTFIPVIRDYCMKVKEILEKEDGCFYSYTHPKYVQEMFNFTRSCVISHLLGTKDQKTLHEFSSRPLLKCSMVMGIVSEKSKKFAKIFLETCKMYQDSILAPGCNNDHKMDSDWTHFDHERVRYCHHTAEQSVFNVLGYKHQVFTSNLSQDSWVYHLDGGFDYDSGYGKLVSYYERTINNQKI